MPFSSMVDADLAVEISDNLFAINTVFVPNRGAILAVVKAVANFVPAKMVVLRRFQEWFAGVGVENGDLFGDGMTAADEASTGSRAV